MTALPMNEATRRQIEAAEPERSTWLSANAGSGKTRVLTDRVARLLLSGTPPQNILCLTFTKAAAGEMQNRLFGRLGEWAMRDDASLAADLRAIGVPGEIGPDALARARRLFASAIETPGGLKIQTIHSFCAALLRQFPMEAGVSPGFREIDERQSRLIRREIFDVMAEEDDRGVLAEFARYCSADGLDALLDEVAGHAEALEAGASDGEILGWFGLTADTTPETIAAEALGAPVRAMIGALADVLAGGTAAIQKVAAQFAALPAQNTPEVLEALCELVLTKDGKPRTNIPKALEKLDEGMLDTADALAKALANARNRLISLEEARRTLALHHFGSLYCRAYAARKAALGLMDFDDLIRRAVSLLGDSAMAQWVLYRLDGGIDHILVDEAQDTSPRQWKIIELLSQEFPAGEGARRVRRTVFAVGDHKQSIYSFQGADPEEFERMKRQFAGRLGQSDQPLQDLSLRHSFRSSPLILRLVDRVFDGTGTSGVAEPTEHFAFNEGLPGRIDLWPLLTADDKEPFPDWHDTSDRTVPRSPPLVLADRIAAEVSRMIAEEHVPDGRGGLRRMTAGDVLILVRRRSFINEPLILALKRAGVEVAGADQIALASELAVMDVMAVLKVLVTPADSLSLAAALRSPIFGLGEGELYALAQGRAEAATLWEALEASRERHSEAVEVLEDLRRRADYLRPFELIERLLVRHHGRMRLRARLGDEVGEALDVLLQQALSYETSDVPSLTGFIAWHEAEGVTIKRQADSGGDKLRVMTVHGAKGLESEVVILPDTADYRDIERARTLALPDEMGGQPVFRSNKGRVPETLSSVYDGEKARSQEEANRLLYVALTRAKNWLIVCGAGKDDAKDDAQPCWHRLVSDALDSLGPVDAVLAGEPGKRAEFGDWRPGPVQAPGQPEAVEPAAPLPGWALMQAEPGPALPRLLSPSRLGGAGHLAGAGDREAALRHGTELHLLLEHLPSRPREDWPDFAEALLRQGETVALDDEIAERLAEARAVLDAPDLAWVFGPDSLAEVEIAAPIPEIGHRILGRIDRLVREADGILAVDFKSNAEVPESAAEVPAAILAQLGAYVSALRQVFPGERVQAAVLWTRAPKLMRLPDDMVLEALRAAPIY